MKPYPSIGNKQGARSIAERPEMVRVPNITSSSIVKIIKPILFKKIKFVST